MDDGWWYINKREKINLKKEGIYYELWRIWWSICTRRTKT